LGLGEEIDLSRVCGYDRCHKLATVPHRPAQDNGSSKTGRLHVFMTGKFEGIYQRHVQSVFRFALSCVGRREIAEEITSDAFIALLRNLDGIDETQLPGWLITVARNRARDYWRRNVTEQRYLEALEAPVSMAGGQNQGSIFDDPGLKPIHRVCLVLRFSEGMTRSEIAREVGLTENQVKGHLQYSLQLLRKSMAGMNRREYEDQRSGTV
jgi:RNA polymerase sigma-70 factor, ECF subfamily